MSSMWSKHLGTWHILRLEIHIRDEIEERIKGGIASVDVGKGEFSAPRCCLPIIRAFMEGELTEDLIMKVITLVPVLLPQSVRFTGLQSYSRATSGSNQTPSSDSQQATVLPQMCHLYANNIK